MLDFLISPTSPHPFYGANLDEFRYLLSKWLGGVTMYA